MGRIEIRMDVTGKKTVQAKGFQGDACFAFTRRLDELNARDGITIASKQVKRNDHASSEAEAVVERDTVGA
jgi:hypothetical protein